MPSILHEMMIDLVRHRPALIAPLLDSLGCELPDYRRVEIQSGDFPQLAPTEYRADAVTVFHSVDGPVLAVVVEVQLGHDKEKVWSWPVYVAALRARVQCPTVLLVLCTDRNVAKWAARPVPFGYGSPYVHLAPLVLDPDGVPVIVDVDMAVALPELTVLSALSHAGHPDNAAVFHALFKALDTLHEDRARHYYDFVFSRLPEAARSIWEARMTAGLRDYEYQSDFARMYYAEGRDEGRNEGRVEGETGLVIAVLEKRGIPISDDARARITACTDHDQLTDWVLRAVTAETADELFG